MAFRLQLLAVFAMFSSMALAQFGPGLVGISIEYQITPWYTNSIWALLHLPADYATSNTYYPLIFFHHGLGEASPNGLESDLSIVLGQSGVCTEIHQGSNMSFVSNGKLYQFIVVCPQAPSSNAYTSQYEMDTMVENITNTYRVDRSRIYMTGLSRGGWVTNTYWASNTTYAAKLAAVGAISPQPFDLPRIDVCNAVPSALPYWAACGDQDSFYFLAENYVFQMNGNDSSYQNVVTPGCNPAMPNGKKAMFKDFPGQGHGPGVWTPMYSTDHSVNNPNLYEWFLLHQTSVSTSGSTSTSTTTSARSTSSTSGTSTSTSTRSSSTSSNSGTSSQSTSTATSASSSTSSSSGTAGVSSTSSTGTGQVTGDVGVSVSSHLSCFMLGIVIALFL